MAKVTLNDVTNLQNESAINTLNSNSAIIETAFENTLSRDGTTPNHMNADLDMNGRNLLNVANLTTAPPTMFLPASSTDNAIVRWDGVGGTTFQNSSLVLEDHGGINDSSSVAASPATVYNPTYFGNPGTGKVHRLNRLFVGQATKNDSITPSSVKDWLETLVTNTTQNSQFCSISALGELGVTGASRSSDFRTAFGADTGGAQGVTGVGYNDSTTGNPISVGLNGIGIHAASVNGITVANQMDMNSARVVVDITPFGGVVGGNTIAGLFTGGAYSSVGTTNVSAASVIGQGRPSGPVFRKGHVVLNGSLDTSVGAGTNGVAFEMARNQSVRWLNNGGTTDAEFWGNATGLLSSKTIAPSANDGAALGTSGLRWSDLFLASGGVIDAPSVTFTHVTDQFQIRTTSAFNSALSIQSADSTSGSWARLDIKHQGAANPLFLYETSDGVSHIRNDSNTGFQFEHSTGTVVGSLASNGLTIAAATATPAGGTAGTGLKFGTTTNFGIFYGSGVPTLSAAQGSLYIRTDGGASTRLYSNNNGSTGWSAITSA